MNGSAIAYIEHNVRYSHSGQAKECGFAGADSRQFAFDYARHMAKYPGVTDLRVVAVVEREDGRRFSWVCVERDGEKTFPPMS
jgi:hypothetical protein